MSNKRQDKNKIFSAEGHDQSVPTRNVMVDDFNWEVPVEAVPVPSEGAVYHPSSPLYGKKVINIKAMTAREEDILTSRALIANGTVINELIRSCVTDGDVVVEDMLVGDRNAIMVAIRITGYGPEYRCTAPCKLCGKSDTYNFNLADMPINRLRIDPTVQGDNSFKFALPVSKKIVEFKFLTGRDADQISVESEKLRRLFPDRMIDNQITQRLKASIISIDGIADRSKINKFVENMPALDSRKLRSYMDYNEPGIRLAGKMKCNFCGGRSEVSLPMGASFFWPRDI